MKPSQTSLRTCWYSFSLDDAGLRHQRPRLGTYFAYRYEDLPTLPFQPTDDFAWLEKALPHTDHIGIELASEHNARWVALQAASRKHGLLLPAGFIRFMGSAHLHERIRSCTDCYLHLSPGLISIPEFDGHLVRFLSDSQSCCHWYLYIAPSGIDHAVLVSTEFYNAPEESPWHDDSDDAHTWFSGESFEEFMGRFWLENEIWFSTWEPTKRLMTDWERQYVAEYLAKPADPHAHLRRTWLGFQPLDEA